jgi:predicted RNA-binding Zn ribbon-like protein
MEEAPAKREPAPGALALVQDFINSTELPGGWDELGDLSLATTWLRAHGFEFTPGEAQRRRIVETRLHLRTLLGVNNQQPLPEAAATKLAKLLNTADVRPVVGADGVRLAAAADGVDGFLATILAALVESRIDGTFRRLKVCRDDTCQWAFYDNSKNACGTWCSMQTCGSRAKARAYRERQRHEGSPAAER